MSDWKSIVRTVAPVLASALGGPIAGAAVSTISSVLIGRPDASEAEVSAAVAGASPELLLKLKEADNAFKTKMAELGVDLERISAEDRASARNLLVQTKSYTPAALSWLVVGATLVMYAHLIWHGNNGANDLVLGRILGTLDTAFAMVLAFWLGSSRSSQQKDDTIKALSQ